jgi:hypothetical protein
MGEQPVEEQLKKLSEEVLYSREDIETIASFVRDFKEDTTRSIDAIESSNERFEEKLLNLFEALNEGESSGEYATYIQELISKDQAERDQRHLEALKEYIDSRLGSKKADRPLLPYIAMVISIAAMIFTLIKH